MFVVTSSEGIDSDRDVININLMWDLKLSATASVVYWSEFLATDPEVRVRFPALPGKKSSGSGTGSTEPREYN
jgi:hypothetical protein